MSNDKDVWQPPFPSLLDEEWKPPFADDGIFGEVLFPLAEELPASETPYTSQPLAEAFQDDDLVLTGTENGGGVGINLPAPGTEELDVLLPAPEGSPVVVSAADVSEMFLSNMSKILDPNDDISVREGLLSIASTLNDDENIDATSQIASVMKQIDAIEGYDEKQYTELLNLTSNVVEELMKSNAKLSPKMIALAIMREKNIEQVTSFRDLKPSTVIEQGRKLTKLVSGR